VVTPRRAQTKEREKNIFLSIAVQYPLSGLPINTIAEMLPTFSPYYTSRLLYYKNPLLIYRKNNGMDVWLENRLICGKMAEEECNESRRC